MGNNNKRFPTPHASSHDLRFRNGFLVSIDPLLVQPVPFPIVPGSILNSASSLADLPEPVGGVISLSSVWLIEGMIDLEGNRIEGGVLIGRSPAVDGFVTTSAQPAVGGSDITRLTVINNGAGGAANATTVVDCYTRSAGGTVVNDVRVMKGCVVDASAAAVGVATFVASNNILLRNRITVGAGGLAIDTDTNWLNIMGQNILDLASGAFGLDSTGPASVGIDRQAYVANLKVGAGQGFGPGTMPVDPTRGGLLVQYSGMRGIVADSGAVDAQGGDPVLLDPQFETMLLLANGQTVNLPPAATVPGKVFRVKSRLAGAGTFTIVPDGAELIDGAASIPQGARGARRIRCDGSAWFSF